MKCSVSQKFDSISLRLLSFSVSFHFMKKNPVLFHLTKKKSDSVSSYKKKFSFVSSHWKKIWFCFISSKKNWFCLISSKKNLILFWFWPGTESDQNRKSWFLWSAYIRIVLEMKTYFKMSKTILYFSDY